MIDEIQDSIKEFENLKVEEEDRKKRMDDLKKIISPYIIENYSDKKLQCVAGSITVEHRSNWEFSSQLQRDAEILKENQAAEIAKGVAIDKGTDFIKYMPDK